MKIQQMTPFTFPVFPALFFSIFFMFSTLAKAASDVDTSLADIYAEKKTTISADDAKGHFDLGYWLYSKHGKSLDGLSYAKKEFETAAEFFELKDADGSIQKFNVTDEDSAAWNSIASNYKEELVVAFESLALEKTKKSKTKEAKRKQPGEFSAEERMMTLHKIADKHDEITAAEQLSLSMYKVAGDKYKSLDKKMNPDYWAMLFAVIGGLGIFLLGMKNMSEGVQAVAGNRIRKMISVATDNRFAATLTGVTVTCLVQSSSITTVIVVGFVNSGLMLLHQAIGVIMGANIGTTITGWILVLKIGKYGLPIIGVAVLCYLLSKREKVQYIALAFMGLGLVFFGLELMKNGFKPMAGVPMFEEAFRMFDAGTYFGVLKCALVGCLLTFLVQSSSATLGITIGLASTGVIPYETAAALVLGENIGTTITAWLASIGATTVAKRAAYFHVLFNIIGVLWITAVFAAYIKLVGGFIEGSMGHNPIGLVYADFSDKLSYAAVVTAAIAATHTGFNVTNTVIFLPFAKVFARVLEKFVPEGKVKEVPHLTHLDYRMVESPVIAIEQSKGELVKMGDGIAKMMDWAYDIIQQEEPDEKDLKKLFHREEVMNNIQSEVIHFLTELMSGNVPYSISEEGRIQVRIADEFESVSDYISAVVKSNLTMKEKNLKLTESQMNDQLKLHGLVKDYLKMITHAVEVGQAETISKAKSEGDAITHQAKAIRNSYLESLAENKVDPHLTIAYSSTLNSYRKIKDHLLNVAEALAGEK